MAATPRRMVLALIAAQLVIWTAVPAVLHTSLPLDVVREGLAWGHEWQWGYAKHPPLVSWLVELSFAALGDTGPFLLSQMAIAATYAFVYLLGRELLEPKWAAAGTVLLAGSYYFSFPTPEFNHNVAQMPLWAGATIAFYKAIHCRGWRWWLVLGATIGIGGLTKYSFAVLVAAMVLYLVLTPDKRHLLRTIGPYMAAAVAVLVMSPHLWWLTANRFVTLQYAADRAGHSTGLAGRLLQPGRFLVAQMAAQLGMVAMLAASGFLGRGALGRGAPGRWPGMRDEGLRFLLFLGVLPAGLVALGSLLTGFGLRDMWGAPMWNWSGLLAVKLLHRRLDRVSLTRLVGVASVFLVIVPAAYGVAATIGTAGPRGPRTAWPDRAMATQFASLYEAATGFPLKIVGGDGWLAGLLAMRAAGRPSVLFDANFALSPWITRERVDREGLLAVWQVGGDPAIVASLAALPRFADMGTKEFAWPYGRQRPPLAIGWGVIAPLERTGCH